MTKIYSYDLIKKEDFEKAIYLYDIIIVDAWAPWCKPCLHFGKKFEELGGKLETSINEKKLLLLKDNIEGGDSIHKDHPSLYVVPTFFVYRKNERKEIAVFTGVEFDSLENFIFTIFQTGEIPPTPNVGNLISPVLTTNKPPTHQAFLRQRTSYQEFQ